MWHVIKAGFSSCCWSSRTHPIASVLTLLEWQRDTVPLLCSLAAARSRTPDLTADAEIDDSYDDDSSSDLSLEVGAEAGADFEAQQRLHAATVAQSGPATSTGEPAAVAPHQSMLRRFSKDHAISEDIQKRFMIAVENDEKAAKTRVQDWLVQLPSPPPTPARPSSGPSPPLPHRSPLPAWVLAVTILLALSCTSVYVVLLAATSAYTHRPPPQSGDMIPVSRRLWPLSTDTC